MFRIIAPISIAVLAAAALIAAVLLSPPATDDAASMPVIYRVNAGGEALDGTPTWQADHSTHPSPYATATEDLFASTAELIDLHSSVPEGTPSSLFRTERWDSSGLSYVFPVSAGSHRVRLYFAEIFDEAQAAGAREIDVLINDRLVLDDYDTFSEVGGYTGVMKHFDVTAEDAVTVEFRSTGVQNPRVMGIEILSRQPPPRPSVPDTQESEPVGQVIHAVHNDTPLGHYDKERAREDFAPGTIADAHWNYSDTAEIVENPYGAGRALKITHPEQPSLTDGSLENEVLSGTVTLPRDYDTLYLQYELAFGEGFLFTNPLDDERHYGGKLPGLAGGTPDTYAPVSCEDADPAKGWSARQMWRHPTFDGRNDVTGPLMSYMYWSDKQSDCGDDFVYRVPERLVDGRFYRITQKVTINDPGEPNGRIEAWVDGRKVLDEDGFRLRSVDDYAINQLLFQSYFGGSTPDWGHPRVEVQYYRNFRVFTGST